MQVTTSWARLTEESFHDFFRPDSSYEVLSVEDKTDGHKSVIYRKDNDLYYAYETECKKEWRFRMLDAIDAEKILKALSTRREPFRVL